MRCKNMRCKSYVGLKQLLFGKSFSESLEFISNSHKKFADVLLKTYELAETKCGSDTVLVYERISSYILLFEKNVPRIISVSKIFSRISICAVYGWLMLGLATSKINFFAYITVYFIILFATLLVELLTVEIYNKAEDRIAIDMKSQLKFVPLNKNGHYDMVKDLYSMRDFLQDNDMDINISEVNMK